MSALTLYCAGTAFDSDSDDIIAWLSHHTANPNNKHVLFVPGPGSTARSARVAPGTQALASIGLGFAASALNAAATGITKVADQALGQSVGGVADAAVTWVNAQRPAPSVINIAGWSRGSITAVLIANALPAFTINLFLFDPVPGGPNQWLRHQTSQINANVASCSVVLMNDEKGLISHLFQPQEEPFRRARPGFRVFVLPGTHGSAVRFQDNDEAVFYDATHIGAHLVCEFLRDHGTSVSGERLLTPMDLIACYGRLMHRTRYGQITGGRTGLTIANDRTNALFYINGHHEALFRSQFPSIHTALAPNTAGRNVNAGIESEGRLMQAAAPAMAQVIGEALELWGRIEHNGVYEAISTAVGYSVPARPTDACFQVNTGF